MKNKQILIIVGVIALILIIANWNKIFAKKKYRYGGDVRFVNNDYGIFNEIYYCCKDVRPDGGCWMWEKQDYPCE